MSWKLGGWTVKPCDTFDFSSWKVNDVAVVCHFPDFFVTLNAKLLVSQVR